MGRKTVVNKITSDTLLSLVNQKNAGLLRDFLAYLRSVQRSESTIAAYKNDIEIAWIWCVKYNENKFYIDWKKRDIVAYQDWLLHENQNSPARVRRLRAALSSLGNYICNILDDEYPHFKNIVNTIEAPARRLVRNKTVWEDDELLSLLSKLQEREKYAHACFLALAMYSGRRKAELCRFRVSDFGEDKLVCGGALYKSEPIKTKGRGDGKFVPCYTLAKKFQPYLDAWLADREKRGIESEWLFPRSCDPGLPITISTVNSWSKLFDRLANKPMYIHSLRHYFTTLLSKSGIPDGVIQRIVHWETSDMVRLYVDTDVDEEIGMYFQDGEIRAPEKRELSQL